MSRLYATDKEGNGVEIQGGELHGFRYAIPEEGVKNLRLKYRSCGNVWSNILYQKMHYPLHSNNPKKIFIKCFPTEEHFHWLSSYMLTGYDTYIKMGDNYCSTLDMCYNSFIKNAPPYKKFIAQLAKQMEVFPYIEGSDRKAIADIVQAGLNDKYFSENAGWEELVTFLVSNNTNEVVFNFSESDSFPNYVYMSLDDTEYFDSSEWDNALAALKRSTLKTRLDPAYYLTDHKDFSFGPNPLTFDDFNIYIENLLHKNNELIV